MDKYIAREAVRNKRAMTRQSVILKVIRGDIRWMHAADCPRVGYSCETNPYGPGAVSLAP